MIKIIDNPKDCKAIFSRYTDKVDVSAKVSEIIGNVKEKGDSALFQYTSEFDGVDLKSLEVSDDELTYAIDSIDPKFLKVLEKAAENIRSFHEKQKRDGFSFINADGITVGQKIIPIEKVGLYVPGGTAAYPSTVLMTALPAKIAGCNRIIMTTPPNREGKIKSELLAAAKIAGVDRIFKIGGAQAVAALAYGTESIPAVYKIVGPGNAFVAEAKRQVFGKVSIDMIAGPSEILIVADGTANPRYVAADMLSQAEHDKNASAVLVTSDRKLANAVSLEIERQIQLLERNAIAKESIDSNGKIIISASTEEAIDIANELAPEHLELCVESADKLIDKIKCAGSVFTGNYCPEALGDYYAGPNHTLPTGGTAKFSSPLSVDDFIKKTQFISCSEKCLINICEDINMFALNEGLTAHGKSVMTRFDGEGK